MQTHRLSFSLLSSLRLLLVQSALLLLLPGSCVAASAPQLGYIGGKVLEELHLPGSPAELMQFLLEYALKQKLGTTLPLDLEATHSYSVVAPDALPGGPFSGKPIHLTTANLSVPLPPGDYIVDVMAYCSQWSVHRGGQGTAYQLGPVEGTQAQTIATLLWRGTLAGRSPQELQLASWAIQSGIPYAAMPPAYRGTVDQMIPEYRDRLKGNFLQQLAEIYQNVTSDPRKYLQTYIKEKYNKTVPLMLLPPLKVGAPPLEVLLARMGEAGRLALDAKKQSEMMLAKDKTDEERNQRVFAGQGEQLPPQPASEGAWTVRISGVAYMRFSVAGGNTQGNNPVSIRILRQHAQLARRGPSLMTVALSSGRPITAPQSADTSVLSLFGASAQGSLGDRSATANSGLTATGVIGYSQGGQGAQALIAVPVTTKPPCDNSAIVEDFDLTKSNPLYGYHSYSVETAICQLTARGCTVEAVFAKMISQINFNAPSEETAPMTNCKVSQVHVSPLESLVHDDPIQTEVEPAAHRITNYTLAGHVLKNGRVIRTVLLNPTTQTVDVATAGVGDGAAPALNQFFAPGTWSEVDERLKAAFASDTPPAPTKTRKQRIPQR